MTNIVVVGGISQDEVIQVRRKVAIGRARHSTGGKGYAHALQIEALGAQPFLVAVVGKLNPFFSQIQGALAAKNISDSYLIAQDDQGIDKVHITHDLDTKKRSSIVTFRTIHGLTTGDIDAKLTQAILQRTHAILISIDILPEIATHCLELATTNGKISVLTLIPDNEHYRDNLQAVLNSGDANTYVIVGDGDCEQILGADSASPNAIISCLEQMNAHNILVTNGYNQCVTKRTGNRRAIRTITIQPGPPPFMTGVRSAFSASFTTALANGCDFDDAVQFALTAGNQKGQSNAIDMPDFAMICDQLDIDLKNRILGCF
jgi:sugar/nucleoside kinase (ribokinase family)